MPFPEVPGVSIASAPGAVALPVAQRLTGEIPVAIAAIACAVAARIGIEHVVGGVAPFVLTFPAVMVATLVAGGRAGTIAAVGCQLLTIRFVFPNWVSIHGGLSTDLANVLLSTVALAGIVWATASYRRAAALLRARCEHRVHTLSLLISEMDHRTKNNFQIAANLLAHQSVSAFDPALSRELDKAALRLESIASVYQNLSPGDAASGQVDLAEHLARIVALLRVGATTDRVALSCRAEHVPVPAETAIVVGLIVNEWVTNALRHAFGEGTGGIAVRVASRDGQVEVLVRDDGECPDAADGAGPRGKGGELMASLAQVIGARVAVEHRDGTRCSLVFPADPRRRAAQG